MYEHFAQRLKERYGIEITPLEYIDLIASPYKTINQDYCTGRKKIEIIIKGVRVIAVKQKNGNKFLVTALPKPNCKKIEV